MANWDPKACLYETLGAFCLTWMRIANQGSDYKEVLLISYAFFMWSGFAISKAHYNPIITIISFFEKSIAPTTGALYILFQFIGSFAAGVVHMFFWSWSHKKYRGRYGWLAYSPDNSLRLPFGLLAEFVGTLFFVFFYTYFIHGNQTSKAIGGFGVAASYTAFALALGSTTGGALNPFLYIAPRLLWGMNMMHLLDYTAGPILGGIAGYFLYKLAFEKGGDSDGSKGLNV